MSLYSPKGVGGRGIKGSVPLNSSVFMIHGAPLHGEFRCKLVPVKIGNRIQKRRVVPSPLMGEGRVRVQGCFRENGQRLDSGEPGLSLQWLPDTL